MIRERQWKLIAMGVVIVVVSGGAFLIGFRTSDPELEKALYTASLTLIFGGLLGGLLKLLLDDLDRGRQLRAEEVQFILGSLNDLKAVYDRTERTRFLLPAQRSAKTYGDEMRDLIEARVRVMNVERAIRFQKSEPAATWEAAATHARLMAEYLGRLLSEFPDYKSISEEQRKYEFLMTEYLKKWEKDPLSAGSPPPNTPWRMIKSLEAISDLLDGGSESDYNTEFVKNLDLATGKLTERLRQLLG